jgi:hypothetical protein
VPREGLEPLPSTDPRWRLRGSLAASLRASVTAHAAAMASISTSQGGAPDSGHDHGEGRSVISEDVVANGGIDCRTVTIRTDVVTLTRLETSMPAPSRAAVRYGLRLHGQAPTPVYVEDSCRRGLAVACVAQASLGLASLVVHDVSTPYFETSQGAGYRDPGFSKERRLEPHHPRPSRRRCGIHVDDRDDRRQQPETKTMVPVIEAFIASHQLPDVTVVADTGMIFGQPRAAIEDAES